MPTSITAILQPLLRQRGVKAALAKQLGVSPSTIGRWEDGTVTPSREWWPQIELFFDLDPGVLGVESGNITERLAHVEQSQQAALEQIAGLRELVRDLSVELRSARPAVEDRQ